MGWIAPRMFAGHDISCPYENQDRARGWVSHAFVSEAPNRANSGRKSAGLPFVPQGKKTRRWIIGRTVPL